MMRRFGVDVERDGDTYLVPAAALQRPDYLIEPDASTASYFLAAAAVTGRTVTVPGLGSDALQGDVRFADVLPRDGRRRRHRPRSRSPSPGRRRRLHGITVNMRDISDTMPTLAAIAPFADGPVRIEDVYNTRVKECDRLDACAREPARGWASRRRRAATGSRSSRPAARRRTSPATATTASRWPSASPACARPGITLDDPGCVKKTFPEFHSALAALQTTWQHDQ